MADLIWTPIMVENRLAEAADVLRRLPNAGVQGFASTWPPYVREYWETYGTDEITLRRPPPSAASITRMDEALPWLRLVDPADAQIIWLRANGDPWKAICWKAGMSRATAHQHWMFGLCVIAWKLNGKALPRGISKAGLIARAKAMQGDAA